MGILVAFILFAIGIVLLLEHDCGCIAGLFGLVLLALCIAICNSGIKTINSIKNEEKVIVSQEITTTYELVPLDFAAYEKDPELSERNASQYIHIGDNGVFTFCYKTTQGGVEGFVTESIYSTNAFFPSAYIGNPKILEITTVYKYELTVLQKIWLFGLRLGKEKSTISYEIYIPENSTFKYEQ